MKPVFVVTLGDIVGTVVGGIGLLIVLGMWLRIVIGQWRARRAKKEQR